MAGFSNIGALSKRNGDPKKVSRPFDAERDGFVVGEGAAVLILESLDFALKRGVPILAEVIGYGATAEAHHFTEPTENGENIERAMRWALQQAQLKPEDIDCINAHGTSTRLNDVTETRAIKSLMGEHARRVPISANKSMLGHAIGAAGAISAAAAVLTIRNGVIPPTINLENRTRSAIWTIFPMWRVRSRSGRCWSIPSALVVTTRRWYSVLMMNRRQRMSIAQFKKMGRWLFDKLMDGIVYLFDLGLRFLESRRWSPRLKVKKDKQAKRVIDAYDG